jgi:hypothetical protein
MSNNLMRDTTISDELHGNVLMNPPLGRSQLAYRDGDENVILDIQGNVVLILGEEEAVTTNDPLKISGCKTEGGDTSLSVVSPSSHVTGDNMTDLAILIHVVGESQIRSEHLTTVLRQSVAMQQCLPVVQELLVMCLVGLENKTPVLNHGLMTALDQTAYELRSRVVCDLVFGLIAGSTHFLDELLRCTELCLQASSHHFYTWFNDFHIFLLS